MPQAGLRQRSCRASVASRSTHAYAKAVCWVSAVWRCCSECLELMLKRPLAASVPCSCALVCVACGVGGAACSTSVAGVLQGVLGAVDHRGVLATAASVPAAGVHAEGSHGHHARRWHPRATQLPSSARLHRAGRKSRRLRCCSRCRGSWIGALATCSSQGDNTNSRGGVHFGPGAPRVLLQPRASAAVPGEDGVPAADAGVAVLRHGRHCRVGPHGSTVLPVLLWACACKGVVAVSTCPGGCSGPVCGYGLD